MLVVIVAVHLITSQSESVCNLKALAMPMMKTCYLETDTLNYSALIRISILLKKGLASQRI